MGTFWDLSTKKHGQFIPFGLDNYIKSTAKLHGF